MPLSRKVLRVKSWTGVAALVPALLCGCVFVPNFGPESRSISESVGGDDSKKAIRLGQSKRDAVIKVLGIPALRTEHDLALGYVHRRNLGYWFPFSPGPCGLAGPGPAIREEWLFLEFDPSGTLRRTGPKEDEEGWDAFIKHVPDVYLPPPEARF